MPTYRETSAPSLLGRTLLITVGVVGVLYFFAVETTQSLVYDAVGVSVAVAMFAGVIRNKLEPRSAWLLLASAMGMFALGDILYGLASPVPSPADMCYVSAYPLFALGLIGISRRGSEDRSATLQIMVITASVGIFSVLFLLVPSLGGHSPASAAIAIAYPLLDLALLRLALVASRGREALRSPLRFVAVGLALMMVADLGFALKDFGSGYAVGSLLDPVWLMAYAFFGAAATHQFRSERVWPSAKKEQGGDLTTQINRQVRDATAWASSRQVAEVSPRGDQALRFQTVLFGVGSALIVLSICSVALAVAWHQTHLVMLSGTYGGVGIITALFSRIGTRRTLISSVRLQRPRLGLGEC